MSRYARQICLPEVGPEGQARLACARVLVVGAGGLGATVLPLLAGAGVGAITLVDHDVVELGNLHRQTLFRMTDLGRPKAEVAAETLAGLNPDCVITPHVARLDPGLARAEIAACDLVIDAADSIAVTYALSDLCRAAGVGLIAASVLARAGHVGGYCGGAPSYRAIFPEPPPGLQTCAEAGVMGPAVAVLGALQAQMALSVLLGLAPSALGRQMSVDLARWQVSGFRFDGAPEPQGPVPALLGPGELTPRDHVYDLRDVTEAPVPVLPRARRLAPGDVPALDCPDDGRVILACASGLRALRAAGVLMGLGHRRVGVLLGGD